MAAVGSGASVDKPASRTLRIGNVPEHFSSPLHIGRERGLFAKHDVDVELVSVPGGTGEMVRMLQSGELDIAIALTEGLVTRLANGGKDASFSIIGTYVDAPLTWAISAGAASQIDSVAQLHQGTIGISQYGSGSHIMSLVLAHQQGWLAEGPNPFQFAVLSDFGGLRRGVNDGQADAFMWETFTTKPFHDSHEVRRIGQITAPWPAFLIAARSDLVRDQPGLVDRFLGTLSEACAIFMRERETGESQAHVARTYHQRAEDIERWFDTVRYAADTHRVSLSVLGECVAILERAKLLRERVDPLTLVAPAVAVAVD